MKIVVTGAAGFLGRIVARRLLDAHGIPGAPAGAAAIPIERLTLVDRVAPEGGPVAGAQGDPQLQVLTGALPEVSGFAAALEEADAVVHLAAVPGGAAEADYGASRQVNLELPLRMLEWLASRTRPVRFVYASSIAVFGEPLPDHIDDDTTPYPTMTYGAHKLMTEIALANLTRLGRIDGLALRLPGLLARPAGGGGMKSAFMSEVFHACMERRRFVIPTRPEATVWAMSATCAADNLIAAIGLQRPAAGVRRAFTLPALRLTMRQLTDAVVRASGSDAGLLAFEPDAVLERQFGQLPPLATPLAETLGFRHDGSLDTLVRHALADAGYPVNA